MSVKIWDKTNGEALPLVTAKESDDIYSTTETKTNKVWIDGKPIYRRVFRGLSFGTETEINVWKNTGAQITDAKDLVSVSAIRPNNDGTSALFNRLDFRLYNNSIDFLNNIAAVGIAIDTLIVEYTKATD